MIKISKEKERFIKMRNEVLEGFNQIDFFISFVISFYYFKMIENDFIEDVLYDISFSSYSRFRIFKKITKNLNLYEPKIFNNLEKIPRIRNFFAHCFTITPHNMKIKFEVFQLKKPDINYKKEYERFKVMRKNILLYITKIWGNIIGM